MLTYNTYLTFDVQSGQMGDLFKKMLQCTARSCPGCFLFDSYVS